MNYFIENDISSLYNVIMNEKNLPVNKGEEENILINKFKKGEKEVFEQLVSTYKDRVYRIVYSILNDVNEADDITQDIFIKIYKNLNSFKGNSSFFTWLYRVTINECKQALRKRRRNIISLNSITEDESATNVEDFLEKDAHNIEKKIVNNETKQMIMNAIQTLPEKYKSAYILKNIDGLSYKEIADVLGISINRVKIWIFRARKKIIKKIKVFV